MDLFEQKNLSPMLIAENKPPFDHPDWIYELKWDGVRCVAYLDKGGTVLRNKRNKDVTAIYPELGQIHRQAKGRCILDGEIFVMHNGKPDFFEMQRRSLMTNPFKIKLAADKLPASFVAFDILYLDGDQLTDRPLSGRKELLTRSVAESERIAVSRFIDGRGKELYKAAELQGLEGIVAKRKDSRYYFGKRTKDWIKCKALLDDDFVVCGYYIKSENLVSVILGSYADGLVYQGHVAMGISRRDFERFQAVKAVKKVEYYVDFPDFEGAAWLAPRFVCKVEYMERTKNGGLRQPVYKGLRDDKTPEDCRLNSGGETL